ncbi:phosphoribosylglycinamide formyltransferase [Bacillus sp. ISL-47]|uniref:phosphoribosylglycinamide formyltransferase n=1 Tax=Bacillus sp. ISL-47 TaxID=2819130 RepID=UPI001BE66965|nr:phosphoribosylglycinamide formyltransferase [Bacillus sp. ISL-47]MBT2687762.1 phosphoribosylglycinamide formyltransferase [Bacillus sp. ISL-47]MBT2709601.1 phosphoribosylglycinamide formyltransferase [Pseudomonas sp. ISL-84]
MKKIAVFASGSGTNFQAIMDASKQGELQAEIVLFVCDRPGAYSIERAQNGQIPQFVFSAKDYAGKAAYEEVILQKLKESGAEYIILAGYMRLIGPTLLKEYEGRIINIHPSLLPAFPGKDAIGQALEANVKVSGVTVHFVDEGMDTGPIIAQQSVAIERDETKESLQNKIHEVEHKLYPQVLQKLFYAKMVKR